MTARLTGAIPLPDGALVRGRGLRDPAPAGPLPEFGLYLGSSRLEERHRTAVTWPHEWIRWPDFLLPLDRRAAAESIAALHVRARSGERVEVACNGGVGRTGTVLACLAVLTGLSPVDAVPWTREHHHQRAVETPWQRRWVAWFAAYIASAQTPAHRASTPAAAPDARARSASRNPDATERDRSPGTPR